MRQIGKAPMARDGDGYRVQLDTNANGWRAKTGKNAEAWAMVMADLLVKNH